MLSQKTDHSNARRCTGVANTRRQHALTHTFGQRIFIFVSREKLHLSWIWLLYSNWFDSKNHVFGSQTRSSNKLDGKDGAFPANTIRFDFRRKNVFVMQSGAKSESLHLRVTQICIQFIRPCIVLCEMRPISEYNICQVFGIHHRNAN